MVIVEPSPPHLGLADRPPRRSDGAHEYFTSLLRRARASVRADDLGRLTHRHPGWARRRDDGAGQGITDKPCAAVATPDRAIFALTPP